DKTSHRPLMLVYRGVSPRMVVQTQRMPGPAPSAQAAPPAAAPNAQAGASAHGDPAAPPAPELVDIQMFFDDYKAVDGVMLPHHVTRSVDGQPTEEWTFKTVKVNPTFKPETFAKR